MSEMTKTFDDQSKSVELNEEQLDAVAGGGQGGKKGCCPACGCASFVNIGGGKIHCTGCGWEGTKASIGL